MKADALDEVIAAGHWTRSVGPYNFSEPYEVLLDSGSAVAIPSGGEFNSNVRTVAYRFARHIPGVGTFIRTSGKITPFAA